MAHRESNVQRLAGRLGTNKTRRPRHGRPSLEALEDRRLLSLTFQFADAVAVTGSGSVDVQSNSVTNDAAGNVYVTGSLQGKADFDPGPGVTNLTSTGGRDVFVAKYDKAGALVWANDLKGGNASSVAQGGAIVVDAAGNVIVSGTYTGTVNFDAKGVNASATFTSPNGGNDAFIARYDANGSLLWARDVAGTAGTIAQGYALAVDGSGNVFAAGSFGGTAVFGSTTLTAGGSFDAFVTKLNASGQFLWARATAGSGSSVAQANGVSVDGSGNVVTAGFYAGTVDFDPGAAVSTLPYVGAQDIYVQKLDPSGNFVWADSVGSPDINQGMGVAADAAGNVYVTGTFSFTANFNPGTGPAANLTAGGFQDAFLLKLDPAGKFAWANDLQSPQYGAARGSGVALDAAGHVFVAGYYQNSIKLDPSPAGATLTSAGGYDVFVAEYDTAGVYVAGQSAGGANFDADFGVGVNASGLVAIAGRYSGPATFGTINLPAQPNKSIFIAQLASTVAVAAPPAPAAPILDPSSDTGSSNSDRVTNATTLVLVENAVSAPGNLVQLLRDGVVVASRTGAGAITDPGPVADGVHVYTVQQTGATGLVSPQGPGISVTVVTRTPATPATPVLLPADDSGVKGDGITNVRQPRVTGSADPNAAIQLLDSFGNVIATTPTAADGSYTLPIPASLSDGPAPFRVRVQDVAGNLSAAGAGMNLVIDATPPAAPAAPALLAADDSGAVGDGITNVKQPRLTGPAEPGAAVLILNAANAVIATTTANAGGTFTVAPTTPLSDGTYALRAQATDAAGNVGAAGAAFTLTIRTTAPGAPAAPVLLPADDSGVKGDGITNVRQPRVTGSADPNAAIQLLDSFGNVLTATTTAADGSYTLTVPSPLADGPAPFRVRVQDAAGNLGTASAGINLIIKATPPSAPAAPALTAGDDTGVKGDGITTETNPHLTGAATAGWAVQLIDANRGGSVFGTGTVGPDGNYSILPDNPLSPGGYALQARVIDVAGNVGAPGPAFNLTIQAPVVAPAVPSSPVLLAADDSGAKGDGITNVNRPRFVGTATAGTTVQLVTPAGTVLGSATVAGDGTYTVSPSAAFSDGGYSLQTRLVDTSGVTGAPSPSASLLILTSTPGTPTAPTLAAADDSGAKGDGITNVNLPHFTGTSPGGTTVQLVNAAGTVLGSSATASNATYTVTPSGPLADGSYTLAVRAVDVAGNVSALSGTIPLTVFTTAPAAPAGLTLITASDTGAYGDGITSVNRPYLSGSAQPGATVQLVDATGAVLATTTAGADGSYFVQPSLTLADGTFKLQARATDAAGNVGAPGTTFTLTIMTATPAAPAAPTLSAADDTGRVGDGTTSVRTPRLTGTAPAGSTVDLLDSKGRVLATSAVTAAGTYGLQPVAKLTTGANPLRARVRDAAGNLGPAGQAYNLTIVDASLSDFGGDGKTDPTIFRPSTAVWIGNDSAGGSFTTQFGDPAHNDVPVPADYNGNGASQQAIFRPSTAMWITRDTAGSQTFFFGDPAHNDVAVPGDYDGVGHAELAVFRPSTAQWLIASPTGLKIVQFGDPGHNDIPVPGDYDGIGRTELAVFRPSTAQWLIASPNGLRVVQFGDPRQNDIPVPGDYDGIGRTELALFRPTSATWIVRGPSSALRFFNFGDPANGDIPVEAPIGSLKKTTPGGVVRFSPAIAPLARVATTATTSRLVDEAIDSLTADGLASQVRPLSAVTSGARSAV